MADVLDKGPGERYLVQHLAGSGKTNSIAWTAHFLTDLDDAQHNMLFDSALAVAAARCWTRSYRRPFPTIAALILMKLTVIKCACGEDRLAWRGGIPSASAEPFRLCTQGPKEAL